MMKEYSEDELRLMNTQQLRLIIGAGAVGEYRKMVYWILVEKECGIK
jgi:hypothetical protein